MNDSRHRNPIEGSVPSRYSAAQTIRSLFQLAVVGLLIGVLLFQNVNLPISVVGLFVVLLLWLIGRTSATPLLLAFQLVLFFREPHRPATGDGLASGVFVVIVLGLLMFLGRDQALKRLVSRRVSDLIRSLMAWRDGTPSGMPSEPPLSPTSPEHQPPPSVVRHVASLVACVLVAQLLLIAFPFPGGVERGPQSLDEAIQLLSPVPSLLVVVIATVILMSALAWRRLTAEQASMYLRSTLVDLHYPDIRMIVRQRIKFQKRRTRPKTPRPTKTVEQN